MLQVLSFFLKSGTHTTQNKFCNQWLKMLIRVKQLKKKLAKFCTSRRTLEQVQAIQILMGDVILNLYREWFLIAACFLQI